MKEHKAAFVVAAIVIVIVAGFLVYWETTHGNRQLVDFKNRFEYAQIAMPDGSVVAGRVTSWTDYSDSDTVQLTIDGKTYLTHYANVVLVSD